MAPFAGPGPVASSGFHAGSVTAGMVRAVCAIAARRATVDPVTRRWGIGVASVALLLAMAWPAVAPDEIDSLPFSNYPMFARPRAAVSWFPVVVRIDAAGVEHRLDLRMVGGTDQPVQAAETVRQAIRRGEAEQLCHEIAQRADEPGEVQVLLVAYHAPEWFRGNHEPVERRIHAACTAGGQP